MAKYTGGYQSRGRHVSGETSCCGKFGKCIKCTSCCVILTAVLLVVALIVTVLAMNTDPDLKCANMDFTGKPGVGLDRVDFECYTPENPAGVIIKNVVREGRDADFTIPHLPLSSRKTLIWTHGFSSRSTSHNATGILVESLVKQRGYNVIFLDWRTAATGNWLMRFLTSLENHPREELREAYETKEKRNLNNGLEIAMTVGKETLYQVQVQLGSLLPRHIAVPVFLLNWCNYENVVANIPEVARELAQLVETLKNRYDVHDIHLVGHSLGSHVSGQAAREYIHKTNDRTTIRRITGLDPAGPCYGKRQKHSNNHENPADFPPKALRRLRQTDAPFVDIIHSNPALLGIAHPLGHADFWVKDDHSCGFLGTYYGCKHELSIEYFLDSIDKCRGKFIAVRDDRHPPHGRHIDSVEMGFHCRAKKLKKHRNRSFYGRHDLEYTNFNITMQEDRCT